MVFFMKFNSNIDKTIDGQYCFKCNSPRVERVFKDGRTFYLCSGCGATEERSLVIDNAINWWLDEENNYWHESVGVIVANQANEWLITMRAIYPFAYALPAGHIDKGEAPLIAAQRELMEETGLKLSKEDFKSIKDFYLPGDSCRRGSDHHLWHLYLVRLNSEKETISLNDEAESYQWLTPDKIKSRNDVVYPLKYIIENIKII